jgi:hypothetical protein
MYIPRQEIELSCVCKFKVSDLDFALLTMILFLIIQCKHSYIEDTIYIQKVYSTCVLGGYFLFIWVTNLLTMNVHVAFQSFD